MSSNARRVGPGFTKRRRVLSFTLATTLACGVVAVGGSWSQARRLDGLVEGARARLEAPFVEAPGLDRVQASTAASMLERAMDAGRVDDAIRGSFHYARALEDLQRGDYVLSEGELASAHRFLGESVELVVLSAALSRGRLRFDDAAVEIERALALAPEDPRALLLASDIAIDRHRGAEARGYLARLARLVPESSTVHNRLGVALEEQGDLAGAERELREAARLDGRGQDAYVNLGRVLRRLARHEDARAAFDVAVTRAPHDPRALLGRGLARAATHDVRGAEADFRRSAELAPNDAEPLLALGDLQRDLGAVSEAVTTYRAAIDREDADAASWLKLGNALALLEDYEEAARAFEAALRRAPDLAAAHNGLGASLMHLATPERGAQLASTAVRRADAMRELERAFELDPTDPNPLMNLALLAEREGDLGAARAAWARVLDAAPGSSIALRRLARLGSS